MLKYKITFVAYLMMILKFLYLSNILTPTKGHRKLENKGKLLCLSRLLEQSIAICLISNFYSFIHLFIILIYPLTYKTSLNVINLGQPSGDYSNLLSKILRYWSSIKILFNFFGLYIDMTLGLQ